MAIFNSKLLVYQRVIWLPNESSVDRSHSFVFGIHGWSQPQVSLQYRLKEAQAPVERWILRHKICGKSGWYYGATWFHRFHHQKSGLGDDITMISPRNPTENLMNIEPKNGKTPSRLPSRPSRPWSMCGRDLIGKSDVELFFFDGKTDVLWYNVRPPSDVNVTVSWFRFAPVTSSLFAYHKP